MKIAKRFRPPVEDGRSVTIKHRATEDALFAAALPKEADGLPPARRLGLALEAALRAQTDLSGADLRGVVAPHLQAFDAKFSHADFAGADVSSAELVGCDFSGANFQAANLAKAGLKGCDLRGAFFPNADLRETEFHFCELQQALISDPSLLRTVFWQVQFVGTRLSGIDWSQTIVKESPLDGALIEGPAPSSLAVR